MHRKSIGDRWDLHKNTPNPKPKRGSDMEGIAKIDF